MRAALKRLRWKWFGPAKEPCRFCNELVDYRKVRIMYGGLMWLAACTFCGAGGWGSDGEWWSYG